MNNPSNSRVKSVVVSAALVAAVLAGAAACSPKDGQASAAADGDTAKDAAAIRAGEVQWALDWKNRALEPLVGHYAHDAEVMAPGIKPAVGSDAIRAALTDVLADPKASLSFTTDKVAVAASGDLAYTSGKYSETATNPKTHAVETETGSYVTVYRKAADGAWKAVADINTPGPSTP